MVIEWYLAEDFSQSTIGGMNGSNACTFICLYFGQVASKGLLAPKQGLVLPDIWKEVFEWAMTSRNDLHDELCDHKGVNGDVDEDGIWQKTVVLLARYSKRIYLVLQSGYSQSGLMHCHREVKEHTTCFSLLEGLCSSYVKVVEIYTF